MVWVPGTLSLGCSFTTLSAAHREMHSRPQPQGLLQGPESPKSNNLTFEINLV